jgi:hypothetical protein
MRERVQLNLWNGNAWLPFLAALLRIIVLKHVSAVQSQSNLLIFLVARDRIEPPTPAFSGPPTVPAKWF